jgi:hypothetical protein
MIELFKKTNKVKRFWDWFSKNSRTYFHFEQNQNDLFVNLKLELNKIDPVLTFEFSSISIDGNRELVISADGIKSAFHIVTEIINQAPKLQNWKFIAFRQPHNNVIQIQHEGLVLDFHNVFFSYLKDNGKVSLNLSIRNFSESPEFTSIVFIMLDNILGEYDNEMYLSGINKKRLDENEVSTLLPISELPRIVTDYKMEYNN